mmetsp:Transcript_14702/g.31348  ORF Transcript_14702/g.31348 Transcript_14702/m.31348 type:complete len:81 (+) Transcript_14702:961-1203(+)
MILALRVGTGGRRLIPTRDGCRRSLLEFETIAELLSFVAVILDEEETLRRNGVGAVDSPNRFMDLTARILTELNMAGLML